MSPRRCSISSMNDHSKASSIPKPRAPKREAILCAALQVFAEGGVNGVAVPQIAVRAGVGTGTIYRYFDSKEALVNELFREQKQALGTRLFEGLDGKGDPQTVFQEFWARLVSFVREAPDAYRFLELQDHLPYLDATSRGVERDMLALISASVRHLQHRGVYRSDLRAEVLMTMIWGAFVQLFKAERDGYLQLSERDINSARDACWRLCLPDG